MSDRMTHWNEEDKCYELVDVTGVKVRGLGVDKLAFYENLDEEYRLLTLPCKIGDIVYKVYEHPFWYKMSAEHKQTYARLVTDKVKFSLNLLERIGVDIFLTPEKAAEYVKENN